jgi:hypothetical protein
VGGPSALNTGQFIDPTNWAAEIAMSDADHRDPIRASLPAEVFEAGNLSALEDEPPGAGGSGGRGGLATPTPGEPFTSSAPPPPSQPVSLRQPTPAPFPLQTRKQSSAASVIVVVLAAFAAVVVAWFAHIIPHR